MRLLLDSHVLIWWLDEDARLGPGARDAIKNPDSLVHVSVATIWEIEIKSALGRLEIRHPDLIAVIAANEFDSLPITAAHAVAAAHLPQLHSDPFDRMLIAQAISEGLMLVSHDAAVFRYDVPLLRVS